ncbi:hypothetical protein EX30DRAFT_342488 [Ascodesmis nigricans]|uniref:Uncharacterized protein n=1 Tax=Ascodesmis nigricans TaxID=341454 RepID=A0A4S2MQA0_9PEZI|nr:hypothetical protein EX30DRAFT_342488 [Ascodesmis nigricans]
MPLPASSTPRKRPHPAGQRQITTFFSPSSSSSSSSSTATTTTTAAPKLAPDLPPDLQSSLLTVGMRVRRSMAVREAVFSQPHYSGASDAAKSTTTSIPVNKRRRDEGGEGEGVRDVETAEQRERARVLASKLPTAAPGGGFKGRAGIGGMGGYWKAVKRRPVEEGKGVGMKVQEVQDELGEAGFLMEVDS